MQHSMRPGPARLGFGLVCGAALVAVSACASDNSRAQYSRAHAECAEVTFPIYFDKGSDQLTAPARQEIDYAAHQVRGCRLGEVEVLGLADADGPDGRNLDLSKRRAAVVAQALATSGLPAPVFDVEALGKLGSRTRGGIPAPLHRRTEVVIHASPA